MSPMMNATVLPTRIRDRSRADHWPERMSRSPSLLRRLLRAKDRIDAAPGEHWPVRRLAEISAVSQAHFAREFRKAFGVPPHRYLRARRIEHAIAFLRDTDLPITQVALQTGWSSLGTFSRVFRDVTGDTPGALRARMRRTRATGQAARRAST